MKLNAGGFTSQHDIAVKFKPMCFNSRVLIAHPATRLGMESGMFKERGVHFPITKIHRLFVFVENHLDDAITLVHRIKQIEIAFFALADFFPGLDTLRDVAEKAHHTVPAIRKWDAVDLPLIAFGHAEVAA